MRWGITFLAWVFVAIYLADDCADYFRVWATRPDLEEQVLPYLTACGTRKSMELGLATGVLVALYFAVGWAMTRFRAGDANHEHRSQDT